MIFAAVFCTASIHAFSKTVPIPGFHEKASEAGFSNPAPPYVHDLDPLIVVSQNVNEKGLVVMSGQLNKPFTNSNILLSIKYQNALGEWVTGWCKTLYSYNQYNETLKAVFELPASAGSSYNLKVELNSDSSADFTSVTWNKTVNHYKLSDYTAVNCDLDENEYTMLLTPKKDGTLITDANGKVTGVKDRVTSAHSWNKLSNVLMDNKKNDVVLSPANPSDLITETNGKSVKLVNTGSITDLLASTPEFIYNEAAGHPIPYLYSYDDPVYIFAGKFSVNGFFMKFSQWPGDANGPGYYNFKDPNLLESRYFNLYNRTWKTLSEIIPDQEPVVIVSSIATGLRIYKSDGTYVDLTPNSTSNYGAPYFGYTNYVARRGPGSENLSISDTSEMSLYGVGTLRNDVTTSYQTKRSLQDIEREISKFIKYTGVFGNTTAYKNDASECSVECFAVNAGATPDNSPKDWTKAPNSYIFTGKDDDGNSVDGLLIPVKKAYAMWKNGNHMGGMTDLPSGPVTADVLWEDNPGLIRSGASYALEITGSGETAKIKVPVNSTKEGNAVIAFKINGEVYWSWHVWVTDNPINGTTYKSFDGVKRQKNDGTVELIPDSEWKWMDRNLGALSNTITGTEYNKNGGLLYQWGRKDPIPPLVYKGNDFYEASGSIGRIRHKHARNMTNALEYDTQIKYVTLSNANVRDNIRLSVKNPLSIIYVNKDDNSGAAVYPGVTKPPVNWFGNSPTLSPDRLSELNLWSDNSRGLATPNYNDDNAAQPYRDKSSYDPCPNGWRIPSNLVANAVNNIRVDFSPFGIKNSIKSNELGQIQLSSSTLTAYPVKPNDSNTPDPFKGFKAYYNTGFDMSGVGGNNMGIYPGNGALFRAFHTGEYTDQHHVGVWSATMARFGDATPATGSSLLQMVPDRDQPYVMDSSLSNISGLFYYKPLADAETSYTAACRCIKDPLYMVDNYNFPPDYITPTLEYKEGINNPNSYQVVKNPTSVTRIEIPVSKAFSVQSELLNNKAILETSNFSSLKANVLWASNSLISAVTIQNPSPANVSQLSNSKILVDIKANTSGNAVITLHNGSVTNPVYWSWHIWVTDTPVGSNIFTSELPNQEATNYVNYLKTGEVIKTEIMDRDLGANQVIVEANKTSATTGLHYQWGRKDPLPVFVNANRSSIPVGLGTVQANGSVTYSSLSSVTYYSDTYIRKFNDYAAQSNVLPTDKTSDKISKVLSYSVKNPLMFMVPSTLTSKAANTNHTNGSDWLANEPNLAPDRWGRGGKKSPFDPCPDGWRIPDVTGVQNASAGSSPFYKPTSGISIPTNYGGVRITRSSGSAAAIGYIFANPSYNIGSFANSGVRGGRNTIESLPGVTPDYNAIDYTYGGFWLGALHANYTGRALRVEIQHNGNYLMPFTNNADPYFGQSCRCVKVKYDEDGNELGPIPRLQVTTTASWKAANVLEQSVIEEKIAQKKLEFFPNPVKSILYIKGNESVKDYYYQVYNMSGQLVKSGKFENEQTDLSGLTKGAYLIRINNSETVVKIIKE